MTLNTSLAPLAAALSDATFYHVSTARSSFVYVYDTTLISYMEPDNVTCTRCRWSTPGVRLNRRFFHYLWRRLENGSLVPPPLGIRSAPPLGGLGAGSVELRADGSFRDWTIFNQGPAGAGKYGVVDDVFSAVRVGGTARVLRTHPPSTLSSADAVRAFNFSGSYPLTRLVVDDDALLADSARENGVTHELAMYGYSVLRPGDRPEASAHPALALTLHLRNNGKAPVDFEFMFSLPLGGWTDCSRAGHNGCLLYTSPSPRDS